MPQLWSDDSQRIVQDFRTQFRDECGTPPTTPYYGEPDRPPQERDGPDRSVRGGSESDDGRDPEDCEDGNDVDAGGDKGCESFGTRKESSARQVAHIQRTMNDEL